MWKVIIGIWALAYVCLSIGYAGADEVESKYRAMAHYIMAVTNDFNSQPADAISEYERSIALNAGEPLPHLRLAAHYARVGNIPQSLRQLKIVLKLDPQNAQARYLLALVYSAQKKYDLAAHEYEQVLKYSAENNPENLEIHIYLAELYYSQGKFSQAIAQFKKILEVRPQDISANYLLGSAYLEIEKRLQAKTLFQKVLSIEPDHDGALNSLGYMYAEEGVNLDEALKMVRKAIAADPSNGAYYDTLGWVLFKKGMNAEALMALQKAETYVQDPVLYQHLGDVYRSINQIALARKAWRKALEFNPHQPQIKVKLEELEKVSAKTE